MGAEAFVRVEGLGIDLEVPAGTLHAVRDVSFEVAEGQTLCIVGESGCGKSMTALGLMGLLPPNARRSARRIAVGGQDLQALDRRAMSDFLGSRMAMIFQEPMTSLNPCYTIGNQMAETLVRHRGGTWREALERAAAWLEKVGIPPTAGRLDQYPHQLSGGLRQRVMFAMMLMCEPKLIIADEPTTALDVTIQAQILHLLARLQRELSITMIFITHDLGVVSRIADHVAVMYAGEVVEYAGVRDLFARPQHPYTRGLLGCMPLPGRTLPGGHLGTIPGTVPSLIGPMHGCAFANRCRHAQDACTRAALPLTGRGAGHRVRCILPAEADVAAGAAHG